MPARTGARSRGGSGAGISPVKFDWYAATIKEVPQTVVDVLAASLSADDVKRMKGGMHGYTGGFEIVRDGGVVARVLAGGRNAHPSAQASGSGTPGFVDAVRGHFGDKHHVSRVDSCADFDEPGAWKRLTRAALKAADGRGLKLTRIESSGKNGNEGRTLYIGSPSSAARVRIYEKGYQMRDQFPGRASQFSPNWVRVEAQLRPQDQAREFLAGASPVDAWGISQTTRAIAVRCLKTAVPRIPGARHDLTDKESAADHMAGQYIGVLQYLREKAATDVEFSRDLFSRVNRVLWQKEFIEGAGAELIGKEWTPPVGEDGSRRVDVAAKQLAARWAEVCLRKDSQSSNESAKKSAQPLSYENRAPENPLLRGLRFGTPLDSQARKNSRPAV